MSIQVVIALIESMSPLGEGGQGQGQSYLVAKRALDSHQGGLWEFPGGKVEQGEPADKALLRELREELAINVTKFEHLFDFPYAYPDKSIDFIVYKVSQFEGKEQGHEGQEIRWVSKSELLKLSFPAANQKIIDNLFSD